MDAFYTPKIGLPAFHPRAPRGRAAGPILATSPLVRAMFEEIDRQWTPLRTLAAVSGKKMTTVSEWRHGKSVPKIDVIERVLDYLQVETKLEKKP